MSSYHEPYEVLSPLDRDMHRALTSFKEEIEAIDWYHQRVVACADPALRDVLSHNRDEEIEHACMTLEWLRRTNPAWDAALRTFVFTEGSIARAEEIAKAGVEGGETAGSPGATRAEPRRGQLSLGDLHESRNTRDESPTVVARGEPRG
jgi:ferritin-like protein